MSEKVTTVPTNEAAERHGCDEWHARGNVACDCYCHRAPGTIYCDQHAECDGVDPFRHPNQRTVTLAEHDAAERRATVERIRAQIEAARPFTWKRVKADPPTGHSTDIDLGIIVAILDEEAAR